jgi:hypothetical protein
MAVAAERLDPLQRIFVSFEDSLNSNTHQLVVIQGHLDLVKLREAICRTAREFDLCTSLVRRNRKELIFGYWEPEQIPCYHYPYPGAIGFSEAPFRQTLMRLSQVEHRQGNLLRHACLD